ncbi:MAG: GMC family oxidoreductase [Cyanobacteria bacterium J06639_18]
MNNNHYDVIIIGTGAGGATLARKLAPSGKRILVLERGNFLPREKANWDSRKIFHNKCYRNSEFWHDKNGKSFYPMTHYYVGGNTKFYGSALFRMRKRDFERVEHRDGISPEWSLKYDDFAPYYTEAEELYEVHGKRGFDPTEPPSNEDYPFKPISHEPFVQKIHDALKYKGLHPFSLPLGIKLNEANPVFSSCIRCETCDGFPCLLDGKADADIIGIRPVMTNENLTLMTDAKVSRLYTNASGREVTGVEVEVDSENERQKLIFNADIVVVACGAVNSALLLLKSANDQHPKGLANSSDLIGRNYMAHKFGVVMSLYVRPNPTIFQKTLALNDFYWGEKDFPYPMGSVQLLGNVAKERIIADGPPLMADFMAEAIAKNSSAWLLMTEDLPSSNNRVRVEGEKIFLDYTNNNETAFNRLIKRWIKVLKSIENPTSKLLPALHIPQKMTIEHVAHQCGTCRFGEDPKTSVLDLNCRTHDIDNLYIVDGSFFPSSSAVNPSLTIIANALRVGEHLLGRIGNE